MGQRNPLIGTLYNLFVFQKFRERERLHNNMSMNELFFINKMESLSKILIDGV